MKVKLRLDFKGVGKSGFLFMGSKNSEQAAMEVRNQQTSLLRNIPIQGIEIEDIINVEEVYTVAEGPHGEEYTYAPAEIIMNVETIKDLMQFILREEFRKIEIIEIQDINLSKQELERLFVAIHEEAQNVFYEMLRKMEK